MPEKVVFSLVCTCSTVTTLSTGLEVSYAIMKNAAE